MQKFFEFVQLREAFDLWKYYKHLESKSPNAEDLKTLATLMAKQYPENLRGMMSDMLPGIEAMMAQLPPNEQADVKRHFANLKHRDSRHDSLMYDKKWRKFTSAKEFEDFVNGEMQKEYPNVHELMGIIKDNEAIWLTLDRSFRDYFANWLKEQERKQPKTLDWGEVMAKAFQEPPEKPS